MAKHQFVAIDKASIVLSDAAYMIYVEWKHPHVEDTIKAAVAGLDRTTRAQLGHAAEDAVKYATAVAKAVKAAG